MARVVDVLSFLEQFRSSIKEKVSLEISDKYAPWNNGTFTITSETVIKEEEECSHTVQMDVNALVPLFFGVYSSQQLYEMGVIKGDRESVAVLNKIRVKPGFFIDFF